MHKLGLVVATAVLGALIVVPANSASARSYPHRACTKQVKTWCVYDALHRDDHRGRSFYRGRNGKRHIISHRLAHSLAYVPARPRPRPAPAPAAKPAPTPTPTTPVPAPQSNPLAGFGAVGDSLTYGIGASDAETKSWPADTGIPKIGRPGGGMWPGWSPALVETFAADVASLKAQGVHSVVVEIGTNDLPNEAATTPAMIGRYGQLQAIGRAAGVRVILATIPPRTDGTAPDGVTYLQRVAEVNEWIRTQDHIDLDPCLGDGAARPGLRPEFWANASDGLHMNDAGYAAFARCVTASQ